MDDLDAAERPAPPSEVDHGLTGLGMLLTLGGDVALAVHGFVLAALLLIPGTKPLVLMVWAAVAVLAAVAQRAVGGMLLFGGRGAPRTYFVTLAIFAAGRAFALVQLIELVQRERLSGKPFALVMASEMLWSLVLLVVALALGARGKLRLASRAGEGVGLEGVPLLMTCLAAVGVCAGLGVMIVALKAAASAPSLETLVLAGAAILLMWRAVEHLRAGVAGARGASPEDVEAAARRYAKIGTLVAVVVPLALGTLLMKETSGVEARMIAAAAALAAMWALASWPRLLPKVLEDRHAAAWADARAAAPFLRSADGGLAAVGWLLAALAALGAGGLAAQAAPGAAEIFEGPLAIAAMGAVAGGLAGANLWLALAAVAAQAWAAVELIAAGASVRARAAAVVCALVSSGAAVWTNRELLAHLFEQPPGLFAATVLAALGAQVAIPVTAAVLAVSRKPS